MTDSDITPNLLILFFLWHELLVNCDLSVKILRVGNFGTHKSQ